MKLRQHVSLRRLRCQVARIRLMLLIPGVTNIPIGEERSYKTTSPVSSSSAKESCVRSAFARLPAWLFLQIPRVAKGIADRLIALVAAVLVDVVRGVALQRECRL